ncbi:hypothetical protein DQ237_12590 [Blastococcus sp. TF02-8]|uniref:hypothetical protein n=1 Tax=Blastococcus sp. TF02-8 TaxID=2250574 RepID=UPI000DEA6A84|nr:hypothetical protein [Blastococcus sp. TF02-8]RBY95961.1 hypothetical protein DQ237_12590 [Blastococcus sp. TF02-8]
MSDALREDPCATDSAGPLASAARPWWRWLFLLPGFAAVGWGVAGLLADDRVPLRPWLTWVVGSALVHDLLLAPLVVLVGALVARVLPGAARPPVVVGLVVSGVLTLVALPFLLDLGTSTEPGFLPLDYGRNLLLLVAGIMSVSTVWAVIATELARRRAAQSG